MQKRWDCLIIVTGLPATGKSRFAQRLARALDLPLLAKDAFKEPLLDLLQPIDAAGSRRLSDVSFALLFLLAPQLAGRGLILEGNFRRGEHEPHLATLLAASASGAQVLCTLDETSRRSRLAARSADPARHRGHRDGDAAVTAADAATGQFLELPGERYRLETGVYPEFQPHGSREVTPDFVTDALILELAHGLRRQGGAP